MLTKFLLVFVCKFIKIFCIEMEVVNVQNVIIKYVPENIVVETYVLSNNNQTVNKNAQQNKPKTKRSGEDPNVLEAEYLYISMDESLNSDDDECNNFEIAESPIKEFTEEEYLEIEDDYGEMSIEKVEHFENVEIEGIDETAVNQFNRKNSILKDWFFSHLDNPYPTEKEKETFCQLTSNTIIQINSWFTNMRKRNKEKITYCKPKPTNRVKSEVTNVQKAKTPKKLAQESPPSSYVKQEDTLSELDFLHSSASNEQFNLVPKASKRKRNIPTNTSQAHGPAVCDICGKTFAHRRMLQCHLKRHDPSKWDTCEVCNKSFPDGLKRHMRTHTGDRPFVCDQCGVSYTQSFALKMHKASHESSGDEYYCDICKNGKAYNNRFKFKYHVRAHFLEKVVRTCEICGFKTNNMKSHMITRHSDLRPFQCEECHETFKFKAVYRTHLLTHSKLTPYACDQCDKTFKAEYSLVRHKVVHSEEKNFVCNICNKAFLLQRYLSKHMKGHTGTRKRHACTKCPKDYSNVTDRRRHMEREHGIIETPNPKYANNKMKKKTTVPFLEN